MWFAKKQGILCIKIFGGSKVAIDQGNELHGVQVFELENWIRIIGLLKKCFAVISSQHAFREFNGMANSLSKMSLGPMNVILYYK